MADATTDITNVVCPITFVKTKIALEKLTAGQILEVKINEGEPLRNVTASLKAEGHRVSQVLCNGDGTYVLLVVKNGLEV